MGDGAAIDPTDDAIVSPVSGTVTVLFPTKHAIGIASDDGAEVLIHLGINTVDLDGKPFDITVAQGDHVSAGQPLGTFDRAAIEAAGCSAQTMVIVTNTADWADVVLKGAGSVSAGAELLELTA